MLLMPAIANRHAFLWNKKARSPAPLADADRASLDDWLWLSKFNGEQCRTVSRSGGADCGGELRSGHLLANMEQFES